jgi:hypothetical protein
MEKSITGPHLPWPFHAHHRARHGFRPQHRQQGDRDAAPGQVLVEGSMDKVQDDSRVKEV